MGESVTYTCCVCGTTLEETRHWGPVCKLTGERVCMNCCRSCEYHIAWSGIWQCVAKTKEEVRTAAVKKRENEMNQELLRISKGYHARKKEEAKLRYIKKAKQKAKYIRKQEEKKSDGKDSHMCTLQ